MISEKFENSGFKTGFFACVARIFWKSISVSGYLNKTHQAESNEATFSTMRLQKASKFRKNCVQTWFWTQFNSAGKNLFQKI